jgi:hypothetical protein
MKMTETDGLFTELSDNEAETINGGDELSYYIGGIAVATGAYQYTPIFDYYYAEGQLYALLTSGPTGQLNFVLDQANALMF